MIMVVNVSGGFRVFEGQGQVGAPSKALAKQIYLDKIAPRHLRGYFIIVLSTGKASKRGLNRIFIVESPG